jgi:hypothetical protein
LLHLLHLLHPPIRGGKVEWSRNGPRRSTPT